PRPQPAVPARQAPPASASVPPLRQANGAAAEGESSSARTTLAIVGGGLAVILIAVLLITQVFGGGNDSGSGTTAARSTTTSTSTPSTTSSAPSTVTSALPGTVVPADFSVMVLNGTAVNGAASRVATTLTGKGYKPAGGQGGFKSAVTATVTRTSVAYVPKSKAAALDIAKTLGLPASAVVPADANATALGDNANVIVTLGSDIAK
ncbi:MAG: LytR cell envelope-related transcriptional attenuator, partial [Solirubrobacterales bacterium]|nr:LytR cell envelope-related transcriptional attenuator [Solirubrobacterales bacterium]